MLSGCALLMKTFHHLAQKNPFVCKTPCFEVSKKNCKTRILNNNVVNFSQVFLIFCSSFANFAKMNEICNFENVPVYVYFLWFKKINIVKYSTIMISITVVNLLCNYVKKGRWHVLWNPILCGIKVPLSRPVSCSLVLY